MAIIAKGKNKVLIPAGNYVARCYQVIHIGTIDTEFKGRKTKQNKVRFGWEFPEEMRESSEGKKYPATISQEYTLSLSSKSNLRKILASWRGQDFTPEELKAFDISKLIGAECMINIIHKPSADGTSIYENIAGISRLAKGMKCPPAMNTPQLWQYDTPDYDLLDKLPSFIKEAIESSEEYKALSPIQAGAPVGTGNPGGEDDQPNDLPF